MRGKCIHYRGGLDRGNECAAGVDYRAVFGPDEKIACRAPCLQEYKTHERIDGKMTPIWKPWQRHGEQEMPCDKRVMPTDEQIAEHDQEWANHMSKVGIVMAAIKPWREQKPRGKSTVIDCPTKCGGKLHLTQAASNGHVWGKCTTPDCVSWME